MTTRYASSPQELHESLTLLQEGDCLQIDSFSAVAANTEELLEIAEKLTACRADLVSLQEGLDTRREDGKLFFMLCSSLRALGPAKAPRRRDGVERAKEEGRYKGRKPIAVDAELFDSVVSLWKSGQITARDAMARLELKPNTFYRRIKEMEEQKMKDYKKVERELREEIKDAARQSRRDLDELKKQVKAEAKEVKKAADEKLELRDVERELRRDRGRAEAEYQETVRQMKKNVEAETKELKKLVDAE